MARTWLHLVGGVALAFVTACGSATPTPQSLPSADTDGSAKPVAKPGVVIAAGAANEPDLTPVPAPGMEVLHMRWQKPAETVASLVSFTQLPSHVVEAATRGATRDFVRDKLSEDVDVDALADLIDVDAPADAVMVIVTDAEGKPQPMAAYAIGLTSLPRALATAKNRAREVSRGVWQLSAQQEFGETCVIAASSGKTRARLVCGDNEKEVLGLARYLATTVANLPTNKSDLHIELKLRPVLDRHRAEIAKAAGEISTETERFKREFPSMSAAADRILAALAQELIDISEDADSMVFDLDVDAAKGVRARAEMRFSGNRSWTVSSMVDGAQLADVAPELFWRLPKNSDMAAYSRSVDPARYEPILSVLRDGAADMLKRGKFGNQADRDALVKLLRLPVAKHVAAVSASGHFAAKATNNGSLQDLVQDSLGWYVYGVDEGPTQLRGYLNELVRTYNRATLQQLMKKELKSDAKSLPRVRVVPAPAALGAGGMAIEIVVPQVKDPLAPASAPSGPPASGVAGSTQKRSDVKVYVLLMADGARSWVGLASQRTELAAMMKKLRQSGSDSLSARTDLGEFRTGKHVAGSFTHVSGITGTIKPIVELVLQFGPGSGSPAGQRILNAFSHLPHSGSTPIISLQDAQTAPKPFTSVTLDVPRESLEDIGFLLSETVAAIDSP